MYRRTLLPAILAGVALGMAGTSRAQDGTELGHNPPVFQTLGQLDATTNFATATQQTCRDCHSGGDPTAIPNRHHVLYGKPIPPGTLVPFPGGSIYTCYTCHGYSYNPVQRDCKVCHNYKVSPHHERPDAVARNCKECHNLVENFNDGHYLPTYAASLVTPKRSLENVGWYDDGTHIYKNTGAGVLDIPVGTYPGNAADTLVLVSSGHDNDLVFDHTSRSATDTTTFTVVVTHNASGNPTATAAWASGGGTAGTLTIGFEPGVTTANAMIAAVTASRGPIPPATTTVHNLSAAAYSYRDEGTVDDHTLYNPRGGDPPNHLGNPAGACNYCHDAGEGAASFIINNHDTHHGIGLPTNVSDGASGTWSKCNICHDYTGRDGTYHDAGGPGFDLHIRICEECHSVESLHNIQADSDDDGDIVDGQELAGFGHVGRDNGPDDSDCWGCHGFEFPMSASLAPFTGPAIPTLYSSDITSVQSGKETMVVLRGAAFTNSAGGVRYEAKVCLTDENGAAVTLDPQVVLDEGSLAVTIPARTRPGNYRLQVVKGDAVSNPEVITVTPVTRVTRATYQGTVTIVGSGFGGYGEGSPTGVAGTVTSGAGRRATTKTVAGKIVSWTDTKIVVDFGALPRDVTVTSLYGTAKASVSR